MVQGEGLKGESQTVFFFDTVQHHGQIDRKPGHKLKASSIFWWSHPYPIFAVDHPKVSHTVTTKRQHPNAFSVCARVLSSPDVSPSFSPSSAGIPGFTLYVRGLETIEQTSEYALQIRG